MEKICNWGNYLYENSNVTVTSNIDDIKKLIKSSNKLIARGNGKCYGDSSLQKTIFSTLKLNKIIHFDSKNGVIDSESGVFIEDVLNKIVPESFFLPVVPGTKQITVGGAIASNIHGKNHHKDGSFGKYVISFKLINEKNEVIECSPTENTDIFVETIGGMGLTGIILSAKIALIKIETNLISTKNIKISNLEEMILSFEKYKHYNHLVGWVDGFSTGKNRGKGILSIGNYTKLNEIKNKSVNQNTRTFKLTIPKNFPSYLLNNFSVFCFNKLINLKNSWFNKTSLKTFDSFFFPLDKIENWNNLYGKNGFLQYQFVLPIENSLRGINSILESLEHHKMKSYLIVIKNFGDSTIGGSLSFPIKGITVAMDFKFKKELPILFHELDILVVKYGGRVYLTKDAHLTKEMFQKMYPDFSLQSNKFISKQFERYL
jgi:decaprenylphospho-beta-D-ribofuranose 2-oxidase